MKLTPILLNEEEIEALLYRMRQYPTGVVRLDKNLIEKLALACNQPCEVEEEKDDQQNPC